MSTPADGSPPAWTKLLRPRPEGYVPPEARPPATAPATTRFLEAPCLSRRPKTSPAAAVLELERSLGTRLPQGYLEYVTTFGEGSFASMVEIDGPEALPAHLAEWRERANEYFFRAKASPSTLDHQSLLEAIPFGRTERSDELVFHPSDPGTIYVLPRHEDDLVPLVGGIDAVIDWAKRDDPPDLRYFAPFGAERMTLEPAPGQEPSLEAVLDELRATPGVTEVADAESDESLFAVALLPEGEARLLVVADFEGPVSRVSVDSYAPEPTPLLVEALARLAKLGLEPKR